MKHTHFANGDLKLKCTATISTVYWKSNEESVQGSGFNAHTAPVSESRGRTSGKIKCSLEPIEGEFGKAAGVESDMGAFFEWIMITYDKKYYILNSSAPCLPRYIQLPAVAYIRLPFYEAKVLFSEGRGRM